MSCLRSSRGLRRITCGRRLSRPSRHFMTSFWAGGREMDTLLVYVSDISIYPRATTVHQHQGRALIGSSDSVERSHPTGIFGPHSRGTETDIRASICPYKMYITTL